MSRDTCVYAVHIALLSTHQVDAAFFHEWEVFALPGGLPFFLAFNWVAMLLLAFGLIEVVQKSSFWRLAARLCAATGALTVGIHAVFLSLVPHAFSTAPSLLVFAAIAAASVVQTALTF